MSSSETDAVINEYFRRLESLLALLPGADRDQLLAEIHEHVEQARAGLEVETPETVRGMLERVGRPEEIAAEAVGEAVGPQRRRRRLGVVAAAIVVVGGLALALGLVFGTTSASPAPKVSVAPTASVGGFPTGIALDAASGTVYVGSGVQNALTAIDTATCNATTQTGCATAKTISTGGSDAIGVDVNETTGTVYAVNGGSESVAVIDARTCNAQTTTGCATTPPLVQVPGGPEFLAVNETTNTVYVANTNAGTVSVIDGTTCNASDHSGCSQAPATVTVGPGAFPIGVDESTNTIYVGTLSGLAGNSFGKDVWVISGDQCDSNTKRGCSRVPATLAAGSDPSGIALDDSTATLYVSSQDGTVSVIDAKSCNGTDTSGCGKPAAAVRTQTDSRGAAFDAQSHTLYVTNAGSNTVSMIDTASCNAQATSGCTQTPPSFPVGSSPRRIVLDPDQHTAYIVNTGASSVSMINTETCNSTDQKGCPSQPAAGTSTALGLGNVAGRPAQDSTCSPITEASPSGGPATTVTSGAHQVGSGSVDGLTWTLWAKNGQTGANALEDAGVVINGHGYGLCPGFPNPAELELLDAAGKTIVYGVIGYPGHTTIKLSTGTIGTFTTGKALPTPVIETKNGVSFFIGTLPESACSYSAVELNSTSGKISAEHDLGFGTCTPNKLSPITFSQGIWQLPAGHFITNFPGAAGITGTGNPYLRTTLEGCNSNSTRTVSGNAVGTLTTSATKIASGTVDGHTWILWASNQQRGPASIENGGLVIDNHWYGLCPGAPNPAEFELIDSKPTAIAYGYIANPGPYTLLLSPGTAIHRIDTHHVRGGTFFITTLPRNACSYPDMQLTATTGTLTDLRYQAFGNCQTNKLVNVTSGHGSW